MVTLLDGLVDRLDRLPSVLAVSLFGSHGRSEADSGSDIDLQIITSTPRIFLRPDWLSGLPFPILAYAIRPAFGGTTKATIVFEGAGEADIVVVPVGRLRAARLLVWLGLHRRWTLLRRALGSLAVVLRPGFRVVKGAARWEAFLRKVVEDVPDPRLDDEAVKRKADCAFADFVSIQRKLNRGELVAAQRWLHIHLVQTNLELLHELRLRNGDVSFHDGRRLEQVASDEEMLAIRCDARLTKADIDREARRALRATHWLANKLTGSRPKWSPQ